MEKPHRPITDISEIWRRRTERDWCDNRLEELSSKNLRLRIPEYDYIQQAYRFYTLLIEHNCTEDRSFHLATKLYRDTMAFGVRRKLYNRQPGSKL